MSRWVKGVLVLTPLLLVGSCIYWLNAKSTNQVAAENLIETARLMPKGISPDEVRARFRHPNLSFIDGNPDQMIHPGQTIASMAGLSPGKAKHLLYANWEDAHRDLLVIYEYHFYFLFDAERRLVASFGEQQRLMP